jgi:hypothetical protein
MSSDSFRYSSCSLLHLHHNLHSRRSWMSHAHQAERTHNKHVYKPYPSNKHPRLHTTKETNSLCKVLRNSLFIITIRSGDNTGDNTLFQNPINPFIIRFVRIGRCEIIRLERRTTTSRIIDVRSRECETGCRLYVEIGFDTWIGLIVQTAIE